MRVAIDRHVAVATATAEKRFEAEMIAQQSTVAEQVSRQVSALKQHVQNDLTEAYKKMDKTKRAFALLQTNLEAEKKSATTAASIAHSRAVQAEEKLQTSLGRVDEVLMQRRRTVLQLIAADYEVKELRRQSERCRVCSHWDSRVGTRMTVEELEEQTSRHLKEQNQNPSVEDTEERAGLYWERQWLRG